MNSKTKSSLNNRIKLADEANKYLELRKLQGKNWMKDVDKVYVIDKNWVTLWKDYVGYKLIKMNETTEDIEIKKYPGEIPNLNLIYPLQTFYNDGNINNMENIIIRHNVNYQKITKMIHQDTWKFFKEIYSGGPEIVVNIIEEKDVKNNVTRKFIDFFHLNLNICLLLTSANLKKQIIQNLSLISVYISKTKFISDLRDKLLKIYNSKNKIQINNKKLRLWKLNSGNTIDDLKKYLLLNDNSVKPDIVTYLEYINSRLDYCTFGDSDIIIVEINDKSQAKDEFIFNIKNIIFKEGICPACKFNPDNTNKMLIYSCSCKEVWYCSEQCKDSFFEEHYQKCKNKGIDEDDLRKSEKSKIGLVGKFSGYHQHDSQEFLNYLIDGLHEDLNRVTQKPIIDKDENNKPDEIKSLEQWYGFLTRNQSLLVDLFYGQYKSILYCPNEKCQNISTTFDPFLSISLPITNTKEIFDVTCFFIFYDISIIPIRLLLPFNSECTIMALRNKIGKLLNIHPFSFLIVKMDNRGNYDYLVSSNSLLKTNDGKKKKTCVNQIPYFLFQINPDMFYSSENAYYLDSIYFKRDFSKTFKYLESSTDSKKYFTEEYEEDESGKTKENSDSYYSKIKFQEQNVGIMKINTDNNHGFNKEYLRVIVHLKYYNLENNNVDNISNNCDRIIFPRIIYFKTSNTFEQIHKIIFNYFYAIFSHNEKQSEESLWNHFFNNIDTHYTNDRYEFHNKMNYPYRIKIINIMNIEKKPCLMCNKTDCISCLLPYSNEKISDLIDKYPVSYSNMTIDNTYMYMSENQRKYHRNWNRDFNLELVWLPKWKEFVFNLNNKVDFDFKLQKRESTTSISIYDCFKLHIKLEKLEDTNEWFCTNCKIHQKAKKKMDIYKSPHILIIHLKRFKNMTSNKLDLLVDFPIVDLDVSPFIINNDEHLPLTYDLFAVSNHDGNMEFGHYYAFGKNPITGLWYRFDDSSVTPLTHKEIVSSSAYVLFYRRRYLENIIELEDIYKKSFINYLPLIEQVEMHLPNLNELNFNDF